MFLTFIKSVPIFLTSICLSADYNFELKVSEVAVYIDNANGSIGSAGIRWSADGSANLSTGKVNANPLCADSFTVESGDVIHVSILPDSGRFLLNHHPDTDETSFLVELRSKDNSVLKSEQSIKSFKAISSNSIWYENAQYRIGLIYLYKGNKKKAKTTFSNLVIRFPNTIFKKSDSHRLLESECNHPVVTTKLIMCRGLLAETP